MQYLQNLQKLMVKDLGFGYTLGEAIPCVDPSPLFTLHRSTKKEDGSPALVLAHLPAKAGGGGGIAPSRGPARADLARAALRQLRSVRHPDVLRYVDSVDAPDGTLYIATEAAVPLSHLLASENPPPLPALLWGLFTLSRALGFLHSSGKLHGRLSPATVFVTAGGDWRLGGFDAACTASTAATALPSVGIADLQYARYMAPEMARGDWAGIAAGPVSAVDSWAYGCLIYEVHSRAFTSAEQLRNVGCIPKGLLPAYQKLLASNPAARAPAGEVVTLPALARSPFVTANLFVEDLALKGAVEREAFLAKIPGATEGLPDGFCLHKLLPLLDATVMAAATAGGGAAGAAAAVGVAPGGTVVSAAAVAVVVHLHGRLPAATFSSSVLSPYVVRWVAAPSADRSLRTELLSQLATFAPALSDADINGGVFAGLVAAFGDANSPALRDAAVKSSLSIAPRLTDKHLNVTLMGHFARLQLDAEPAIRTNTTVCIGKLASRLTPAARAKVLLPAFLRALKDPFPPARSAALAALLAAVPLYSTPDAAVRVLPAAAPCLVDSAADVRAAAFALLAALTPRLEAHSADMGRAADAAAASAAAKGSPAGAGGGSGPSGGLGAAGWGMSSLSSLTSALLKTGAGAAVANGGGGGLGGAAGGVGGGVDPAAAAAATQRAGAGVGFGSDSWSSSAATPVAAAAPAAAGNGPPGSAASSRPAGRMAGAALSSGGRPLVGGPATAPSAAAADDADDAGSDWGDLDDTFGAGGGGDDDDEEEAAAAASAAAAATGRGRPGGSTSSVDAFFGASAASPAGARRPPGGGLGGLGGLSGLGAGGPPARPAGPPAQSLAAAPPRRSPAGRGRPAPGRAGTATTTTAAAPSPSASGRPLGRLAAAAASRKTEADDWEALLGSTGPARPRKR